MHEQCIVHAGADPGSDFLRGSLNIEMISEARGLGAQPSRNYRVF